ncbi:alkane 1-monooxygenase [Mongoliitalea daihaiensis]|uniref:alkane 1-monooxygenase n=1 Tax=Mongoliitalea daihaiensis TaxID=2782006 RepID=UPI001F260F7B|nr:alkane 1-monooxygenase [Mongoliitalea daihaiensis]UJP63359.1 alkane 1-monooxygenase [Mongoliitalea daihaiensis]
MLKDLKYLSAYLLPLSFLLALVLGGVWSWASVILAFGIFPILDALLPASTENLSPEKEAEKLSNRFFDILLYLCAPICYLLIGFYFYSISNVPMENIEKIGLTFSLGVVLGALGINVSHELGHRATKGEQFLAKMGLLPVLYMHFFIEHNRGHHKHVSTPLDPATAKKGEWIYVFFFRSIFGQYRSAWMLEKERLAKKGLSMWTWKNEMIRFQCYQILYLLSVGVMFGWSMVPFALSISLIAVLLLETINYIEHYGLQRRLLESGRYERVLPKHSWNSDHEMGRIVLFELTRHSDHHYLASRKYQLLRHMDESPQLPTGYPGSMLMALVPPLWMWMMNKRVPQTPTLVASMQ